MLVGKGATIRNDHASYRISTFSGFVLEYSKRGIHDDGASGKGTAFGTFLTFGLIVKAYIKYQALR